MPDAAVGAGMEETRDEKAAASETPHRRAIENAEGALASCIRGGLAAAAFAAGALWLVRSSKATGDGVPTLGLLLVVGYGCWGTAWALLRHLPV